jgi:addiction module RelB/DinJ family antitoxin
MAIKQTYVRAGVDKELKEDSEKILQRLGLTTAEAIRLFLVQIRIRNGIPFPIEFNSFQEENDDLLLPNDRRQAAIDSLYDD